MDSQQLSVMGRKLVSLISKLDISDREQQLEEMIRNDDLNSITDAWHSDIWESAIADVMINAPESPITDSIISVYNKLINSISENITTAPEKIKEDTKLLVSISFVVGMTRSGRLKSSIMQLSTKIPLVKGYKNEEDVSTMRFFIKQCVRAYFE